ncbi:MAG: hypothetical protein L0220_26145, partial [Acidobacteria bacterium]|nr:hypothetical protein [Acidobacteriota bacterium]
MIGIALSLRDSERVSEFFELFKTPWEYFRPGRVYDVVISDQSELDMLDPRMVIFIHRGDGSVLEPHGPILLRTGDFAFPVYSGVRNIIGGLPLIIVEKTGECVGYRACAE